MEQELTSRNYVYADILIALAQADGVIQAVEKQLVNDLLSNMSLNPEKLEEMWLTPRTLDVIENLLKHIEDDGFKRCLLKDCYLLAYADEEVDPQESKFIRRMSKVMDVSPELLDEIHTWVTNALEQKQKADKLFGS